MQPTSLSKSQRPLVNCHLAIGHRKQRQQPRCRVGATHVRQMREADLIRRIVRRFPVVHHCCEDAPARDVFASGRAVRDDATDSWLVVHDHESIDIDMDAVRIGASTEHVRVPTLHRAIGALDGDQRKILVALGEVKIVPADGNAVPDASARREHDGCLWPCGWLFRTGDGEHRERDQRDAERLHDALSKM